MKYSELLYGPVFGVLGVPAVLEVSETFGSVDLTVVDKTDGLPADFNDIGPSAHAIRPACVVMMSELSAKGVPLDELDGSIITFNSKTWRVESHALLPSPGGEVDGQMMFYVIKGED